MTSFEVQHPRATDGTFAPKDQGAPEVSLNGWPVAEAPTRTSIWSDALERGTADRAPAGSAQTATALRNTRGEADSAVRRVILRADTLRQRSTTRDFDIVGPSDGRPILVDVRGGMFRLKVTSGHAIVRADSGYGNVVTVSDGATATVLVENDGRLASTPSAVPSSTSAARSRTSGNNIWGVMPATDMPPLSSKSRSLAPAVGCVSWPRAARRHRPG